MAFACGFDHELHRATIRQQPDASWRAFGQAHFVQHHVGDSGVVDRPLGQIGRIKERALGQRGHPAFLAKAEIEGAIDHAPVNAHRQRAAEPGVAHHFAPCRIGKIQVGVNRDLAGGPVGPQERAIGRTICFAFFQYRHIAEIKATGLQVRLARVGFCGNQTGPDNAHFDDVNIG